MEKDMTIDLRKDAPNQVSNVNPDELSKEINTLQEIKQEVINQETKLKELKEREKYYSNIIIPDLMNQLNLKNGNKPTYRTWKNKTQKNNLPEPEIKIEQPLIHPTDALDISPVTLD